MKINQMLIIWNNGRSWKMLFHIVHKIHCHPLHSEEYSSFKFERNPHFLLYLHDKVNKVIHITHVKLIVKIMYIPCILLSIKTTKLNYLDQNKYIYIIHDDTFVPALSMMILYMTSLTFFSNILASSITISYKPCDATTPLMNHLQPPMIHLIIYN